MITARARSLAAGLALVITGCETFRELFPRREEVFVPIPLKIGERRVIDGDSVWVLSAAGWEARSPRQEPLIEIERMLATAARRWERTFGTLPVTPVVVLLRPVRPDDRRRAEAPDTILSAGPPPALVAHYLDARDRRAVGDFPVSPRTAARVAAEWLLRRVDSLSGTSARRADTLGSPRSDALPDWIELTLPARLGGGPEAAFALGRVASVPEERLIPLERLLAMAAPAPRRGGAEGESAAAIRRRGGDPRLTESSSIFSAQSHALLEFLAEQEGEPFLGWLVGELARGRSMADALATAAKLPRSVAGLEPAFRAWLEVRARRRG